MALLTPFLFLSQLHADELTAEEVAILAQAGAQELGLELLRQTEPDAEPEWYIWHKSKMTLLRQSRSWPAITQELANLPKGITAQYRAEVEAEAVNAYLFMGDAVQARDLLFDLIWSGEHDEKQLAQWRRQVLQSYLVEGRNDNAHAAMLRYEQDYPGDALEPDWLGLKGRVLVAAGQANEAAILTVASDAPQARSVYVLGRLKGLSPLDDELLQEALRWLEFPLFDPTLKLALFEALFDKVGQVEDLPQRIAALEALLEHATLDGAHSTAVVDALWLALEQHGQQIANRHQLLVGNFEPWFSRASDDNSAEPYQAEALYAWLSLHAKAAKVVERAHQALLDRLQSRGKGALLQPLYLSASDYADPARLPLVLRYHLIDMALAEADKELAARLMSGVDAPAGVDLIEWQLRRARLQVIAAVPAQGATQLQEIAAAQSLTPAQGQNLILAAQDLHRRGADAHAAVILEKLLGNAPDNGVRQQALFWLGEISFAQEKPATAAAYYLRSAALLEGESATLAREWAAQALADAGFSADAVRVYRSMISTADPQRRDAYQYQIRRLLGAGQ